MLVRVANLVISQLQIIFFNMQKIVLEVAKLVYIAYQILSKSKIVRHDHSVDFTYQVTYIYELKHITIFVKHFQLLYIGEVF